MKKFLFFALFVALFASSFAQGAPCLLNFRVAQKEFSQHQYDKALSHFQKARTCPDADTVAIDQWIQRCLNAVQEVVEAVVEPMAEVVAETVEASETVVEAAADPMILAEAVPVTEAMGVVVAEDVTEVVTEGVTEVVTEGVAEVVTEEVAEVVVEPVEEMAVAQIQTQEPEVVPIDIASLAYMKINDVKFANLKRDVYLAEYGDPLYASDMRFLTFEIFYDGLEEQTRRDIQFQVRLTDQNGNLITGKGAPEGFTAQYDMTVLPGKGQFDEFGCRGRNDTSIYRPGVYLFEIWYQGKAIYAKELPLLIKPGEASFLSVNGEFADFSHSIFAGGGRKVYTVDTDGKKWWLEGINPRWVTVDYLPDNQFAITYKPDYTANLTPYAFWVTTGNITIRVDVIYTREGDLLYSRNWSKLLEMNTNIYDLRNNELHVVYKGQLTKREKSEGYGIYSWDDGACYLGQFHDDHREGDAIYITPPSKQTLGGEAFFVGHFNNSMRSGEGRAYDVYGRMIYNGAYMNNAPQGKIPMECPDNLRFECQTNDDGTLYLGETKDGVRHGYGIVLHSNGDLWCGRWVEGKAAEGFSSSASLKGVR